MDQFNNGNSHHIQGTTVEGVHCYECHWEADGNGLITDYHESNVSGSPVDVVIYGDGARPSTYDLNSAIRYTADGTRVQIKKLNNHCIGCHRDENNSTAPFANDSKTPSEYAWDGSSIGERYSQFGTTTWGKYTEIGGGRGTGKNQTKAYSAHGNAINNEGGWDTEETWPNTRGGTENVTCFDCHNSHGSSVSGVTTSYTSAATNGGILKDTQDGRGGYETTYQPVAGGSATDKNVYNAGADICFDCHMNADVGDWVWLPDQRPWGYNATFGATQPILGFYDNPYFGPSGMLNKSGTEQRYSYKSNLTNKGGHLRASYSLSGSVSEPINGLCTPCHDPHGVSTTLDQEYAVPLLKGTWMTSLYKQDATQEDATLSGVVSGSRRGGLSGDPLPPPGYHIDQNTFKNYKYNSTLSMTETVDQFGGLCLRCHSQNAIDPDLKNTWKSMDRIHDTVKGWGANKKHFFSCSKCHSPHNTRLPRLMITNCLDYRHRGRVTSGGEPLMYTGYGSGGRGGGSGCGLFPSGGSGGRGGGCDNKEPQEFFGYAAKCHEDLNALEWPERELWNSVTEWEFPTVGQCTAVGAEVRTTISWVSGPPSTSCVDYGPSYGTTICSDALVTNHSVSLTGLENHTSYSYRVRSNAQDGTEMFSRTGSFTTNVPPSAPTLINEPDSLCDTPCDVTLEWNPAIDPDGGTLQYKVEVNNKRSAGWGVPEFKSGWISATSYTFTIDPDSSTTWWWRVVARHGSATSEYSNMDSFRVVPNAEYPDLPPSIPLPIDEPDIICESTWCSVTLEWYPSDSPSGNDLEYRVQVAADGNWSNLHYDSDWITGTSASVSFWKSSKTWHWRVKARDAVTYAVSFWSDADTFMVRSDGPLIISGPEASSVTVVDGVIKAYITWTTDLYATSYVDYGLGALYGTTVGNDSLVTTHQVILTDLENHKTYLYRVRSTDGDGDEVVSAAHSFNTEFSPSRPVPIAEPDIECPAACAVTLEWNESSNPGNGGTIEYQVQVNDDRDTGWDSPDYDSGWSSGTSYEVTLRPDDSTIWYWRVRARDASQTDSISDWSTLDGFSIAPTLNSPPLAPLLIDEEDFDGEGTSTSITLVWEPETDPDGHPVEYYVEVDDAPDFSSPEFISDWIAETNYRITVGSCTEWWWRVKARDAVDTEQESAWSETDDFSDDLSALCIAHFTPSIPTLIDEPDNLCDAPCNVTLEWNASTGAGFGPYEYRVQIDNNKFFGSVEYDSGWILGTDWTDAISPDPNNTWWWRVRVRDSNHPDAISDWSFKDSFRVVTNADYPNLPPTCPNLIPEQDNICETSCDVTLEWEASTNPSGEAIQYKVQVDDASNFSSIDYTSDWQLEDVYCVADQCGWTINLPTNKTWYWRIRARDNVDTGKLSVWSDDDSFMVRPPSKVPTVPVLIAEEDFVCLTPTCDITLEWNASTTESGDPVEYKVQVDDNSDFSSPEVDTVYGLATSTTETLVTGTTWHWRVMARNVNFTTETSSWSATDIFALFSSNPPPEPILIDEPDISEPVPALVTLEWNAVTDPDGEPVEYYVEVDDNSDFSSIYDNSGWISPTSWDVTIDTATTWYWRVKARDSINTDAESPWSSSDSFIIYEPPPAPVLIDEPDLDSTVPVQVTLSWNPVTAPDGDSVEYFVQVDTDPGFGSPLASPWLSEAEWDVTLDSTTTWYWRVQARDSVHNALLGPWSTSDSFDVFTAPPAPELIDEPDTYGLTPVPVTLEWNSVTAPDGHPVEYGVQISDSALFLSPMESGWISATSWDISLETDKTWYWRVRARDAVHTDSEMTAEWSTADSFALMTPAAPPVPTLIDEPDIHVVNVPTDVTFEWNPVTAPDGDPVLYQVQYSKNATFTYPAYLSPWVSDTSWTGSLNPGTWYWRVRAMDSVHTFAISDFSTSDSFVITADSPPAPELIDETDVVSAVPISVTLEWNSVTCPDGHDPQYYVEVDDDSDFSSINYNSTWQLGTSWSVTVDPDKTWYWRVKARDSYFSHWFNESDWSAADSFSVMPHNPPGKPSIQAEPDIVTTEDTTVTLQWWAVTSPDGDPVEYYVEVDNLEDFSSPDYTSGWISGDCVSNVCTWDVTLPPGYWCWRVRARDTVHISAVSQWSNTDIFYTMSPPSAPVLIEEPDIASTVSVTVTFEWLPATSPLGNPVEYDVQVFQTSPLQIYNSGWTSDTHFSITLDTERTYNWKVRTRDAIYQHAVSAYSPQDSFTIVTSNAPPTPALVEEPDIIGAVPVDVTFEWEDVDDPDGDPVEYQVWVSQSTFFSPRTESGWMTEAAASCDGSTCSWTASITTAGTWYWRVQARDANHTNKMSAWAAYDTFRALTSNPPPAPTLIEEPDIIGTVAVDVTLEWNQVADPDGDPVEYYVKVCTNTSCWFGTVIQSGWMTEAAASCDGSTCSWTTNINPVTYKTWHWMVQARDANNTDAVSAWSAIDSFSFLSSNPPPTPTLTSEPDIPTDVPVDVTLEWEDVDDPDGDPVEYDVTVSGGGWHDSGWLTEAAASCDGSTCSWTVTVNNGYIWQWKVQARDANNTDATSAWSNTDYFSTFTSSPPPRPALISEPDINIVLPIDITLEWEDVDDPNGDPVEYFVQVDDTLIFNTPNYESGWITEGEASCDGSICSWTITFSEAKTWFWRVKARDADHTDAESSYSLYDSFIISSTAGGGGPENPSAPTLLNEPDDLSIAAKDVTLEWAPVTAPDGDDVDYYVEVDDASDFSSPTSSGWISETTNCISYRCSWTATSLDTDITWYKVSAWSGIDSFIIHAPIIYESFEKNVGIDGTGYDETWTETVDAGNTLDPDSAVPGITPPADAGTECLQSISAVANYQAFAQLDYGVEQPKTFMRLYIYIETEDLVNGDTKNITNIRDGSNANAIILQLNQNNSGVLRFNFRLYNNGAWNNNYYDISLNTWYRVDIKYDDTNNTWEWKFSDVDGTLLHQVNGTLTGVHRTGIKKWRLGFQTTSQALTGTIYYDLFSVNTISYLD
jgi:hypothetical protein